MSDKKMRFAKIKEITGVLLKNSDTDLLFDFLK